MNETRKTTKTTLRGKKSGLQEGFGRLVRARRLHLGITQETLADRVGLHFTYISSLERGRRNVSLANISKLADGLECSMSDLMPGD